MDPDPEQKDPEQQDLEQVLEQKWKRRRNAIQIEARSGPAKGTLVSEEHSAGGETANGATLQDPTENGSDRFSASLWRRRFGAWAPVLCMVLLCVAAACWLYWPLPLHLSTWRINSNFSDSHVWCFEHVYQLLTGQKPFALETSDMGYPYYWTSRFIGWGAILLAIPFQPILGPAAAYNLIHLLSPALSALGAYAFVRRVLGARPWVSAWASLLFGLSPFVLSSLANGQIEKAQVWAYPLVLLCLWEVIRGPRRRLALVCLPLLTLLTWLTEPYMGMFLPLCAAPLALVWALEGSGASAGPRLKRLGWATLALGIVGLSLLPSRSYFLPGGDNQPMTLFRNAEAPKLREGVLKLYPYPAASPTSIWIAPELKRGNAHPAHHLAYLGLPLLAVGGIMVGLRGTGMLSGLLLVLVGSVLAMGPQLITGDFYRTLNGHPYYLPVMGLELLEYPLKRAGQYYRAIPLASLGFCVLVAGGLSRLRSATWAHLLAGVLVLGILWDIKTRCGSVLWSPVEPMTRQSAMLRLGNEPETGAVLTLPFEATATQNGARMLDATQHRRPISALARLVRYKELAMVVQRSWINDWPQVAQRSPEQARAFLRGMGFRYVVWYVFQRMEGTDLHSLDLATLEKVLGAPQDEGEVLVWDLGPTQLNPQRLVLPPPPLLLHR